MRSSAERIGRLLGSIGGIAGIMAIVLAPVVAWGYGGVDVHSLVSFINVFILLPVLALPFAIWGARIALSKNQKTSGIKMIVAGLFTFALLGLTGLFSSVEETATLFRTIFSLLSFAPVLLVIGGFLLFADEKLAKKSEHSKS